MRDSLEIPHIAGKRISTKFVSVSVDKTAGEVKKLLVERAHEFEIIDYIYVVDEENVLVGVMSISELLQADDWAAVGNLMRPDPVAIDYHTDQERMVYLVMEHDLKAMPVVDGKKHLQGVVPYHTILDVFHHEFREDIFKLGGFHNHSREIEDVDTPASRLIRARLPPLAIGLLGGLLAAYIVIGFEDVLNSYIALAAFIPVMVYLSDAVGTQSQTLVVRMLALEPTFSLRKYLLREIKIGGMLGITFAVLLFLAGLVGWGSPTLGLIIGVSVVVSIVFQASVATYLSTLLSKFKIDPAVTSGPLTTIISDITSLAMYFTLASLLIQFLEKV